MEGYQVWQRKLGRDVNPTELIGRVRDAGVKRVRVESPEDIVVPSTSIAGARAVSVVYGGLEDD